MSFFLANTSNAERSRPPPSPTVKTFDDAHHSGPLRPCEGRSLGQSLPRRKNSTVDVSEYFGSACNAAIACTPGVPRADMACAPRPPRYGERVAVLQRQHTPTSLGITDEVDLAAFEHFFFANKENKDSENQEIGFVSGRLGALEPNFFHAVHVVEDAASSRRLFEEIWPTRTTPPLTRDYFASLVHLTTVASLTDKLGEAAKAAGLTLAPAKLAQAAALIQLNGLETERAHVYREQALDPSLELCRRYSTLLHESQRWRARIRVKQITGGRPRCMGIYIAAPGVEADAALLAKFEAEAADVAAAGHSRTKQQIKRLGRWAMRHPEAEQRKRRQGRWAMRHFEVEVTRYMSAMAEACLAPSQRERFHFAPPNYQDTHGTVPPSYGAP